MKWPLMDRRTFMKTVGASAATAAFTSADALEGSFRSGLLVQDLFDLGLDGKEEIALFAVGSEGVVDQWDGYKTPKGMLLRWFARPELGFPDYGYDIYRSRPPKTDPLPLSEKQVGLVGGKQAWVSGEVFVDPPTSLTFQQAGTNVPVLAVDVGRFVGLRFSELAWYVRVQALAGSTGRVKAYYGGVLRLEHRFSMGALDVEWCTRGIDRIELVGPVRIVLIEHRFRDATVQWQPVKHLCLPVTHPNYRCRAQPTIPDADEAKSRVPVAERWSTKYQPVFSDMYPTLKALAGRETPSPIPSTPDGQPNGPTLVLDSLAAVNLAALDPHVARILGLAWDDPLEPRGFDGEIYGYKIVGRWWREPTRGMTTNLAAENLLTSHGISFERTGGTLAVVGGGLRIRLGAGDVVRFTFPDPIDSVRFDMPRRTSVPWRATGEEPSENRSGVVPFSFWTRLQTSASISSQGMRILELLGPSDFDLRSLAWTTVPWIKRIGTIPGIRARESGPPTGPTWMTAAVRQPMGTAAPVEAALDWEVRLTETDLYAADGTIFYQIASTQVSTNPAAPPPAAPPFDTRYLLFDRDWIIVPPALAAALSPRELHIDRGAEGGGLAEGWRCWWTRGVDLFGRVSAPSSPSLRKVEDTALPPAPILLLGEYVQADLAALGGPNAAQSPFARDWLTTNPTANAFIVSWAWTPELQEQCSDVDGFRIFTRRVSASAGSTDPSAAYDAVPWSSSFASIGPVSVRFNGQVSVVSDGIAGPVSISAVSEVAAGQWQCITTLPLQIGAGALAGATLVGSSGSWTITGHGEGANVTLFVSGSSAPAVAGGYSIAKGTSDVVEVATNISIPANPSSMQRRLGGALMLGDLRLLVLHAASDRFVCRTGSPTVGSLQLPGAGTVAYWYPAYTFAIADSGLGPQASLASPIAYGQLTARSVRRWSTRPLESPPASPAPIHAVDVTKPSTPPAPAVASGDYCAELATRADWYGRSRFILDWTADNALTYMVYRALGDAVIRLDLAAHTIPSATALGARQARAHSIAQPQWIPDVWNDAARRQLVQNDLAALDAALTAAVPLPDSDPTRRKRVSAAYAALHADTQRLLAYQAYARAAFVARFGKPIDASKVPYVDEIDGRSRAHWFYRIASRTPAGMESEWTAPTPPICCPDVIPPSTPQVLSAVAAVGKVRLRWLASPESDVQLYRIYRTQDQRNSADIRLMEVGETVAASPQASAAAGVQIPSAVIEAGSRTSRQGWLQFDADAAREGAWYFRLVAIDNAGNQSRASELLCSRSLRQAPVAPVWRTASRQPAPQPTYVSLSWTHPQDLRLACLVERRFGEATSWIAISGWLPRGAYEFQDRPADLSQRLEYRLRVRNVAGLTSAETPSISVPALQ
jgi:hypothetical protein